MVYYCVVVLDPKCGQARVIWTGDDSCLLEANYRKAYVDPLNQGCWVMTMTRLIGRFVIPRETEVLTGGNPHHSQR